MKKRLCSQIQKTTKSTLRFRNTSDDDRPVWYTLLFEHEAQSTSLRVQRTECTAFAAFNPVALAMHSNAPTETASAVSSRQKLSNRNVLGKQIGRKSDEDSPVLIVQPNRAPITAALSNYIESMLRVFQVESWQLCGHCGSYIKSSFNFMLPFQKLKINVPICLLNTNQTIVQLSFSLSTSSIMNLTSTIRMRLMP